MASSPHFEFDKKIKLFRLKKRMKMDMVGFPRHKDKTIREKCSS